MMGGVDRMGDIERWWRVTPRGSTYAIWCDTDPSDQLQAAWEGAAIEGPFVPEADLRGAVVLDDATLAALDRLARIAGTDRAGYLRWVLTGKTEGR